MRAFSVSFLTASFLTMSALVGGCSPTIDTRGNLPEEEQLSQIKPGQHKAEVAAVLGSPSTVSAWDDNEWYYIGYKTETFAFFKPEELERKVVVLAFDNNGVLQNAATLTKEDGVEIQPIARETPTSGNEFSIWEQLVGNIGRFKSDPSRAGGGFDLPN